MSSPIAIQLYTLREALAKDFAGVMTKLAEIGYVGVETAFFPGRGFPGVNLQGAAKLCRDLKLYVPGIHSPMPLGDQKNEVLETAEAFATEYIVVPSLPRDEFKTVDGIKALCARLNEASVIAKEHKFELVYHNHDFEFETRIGNQAAHEVMRANLDPSVSFELDTYWIKAAGVDPVQVVKEIGARAPLLHIKDGPARRGVPQVAVGSGTLDVPAIVNAGGNNTRWLIVELDDAATDMLEAVRQSYSYLVSKGLARGNKS